MRKQSLDSPKRKVGWLAGYIMPSIEDVISAQLAGPMNGPWLAALGLAVGSVLGEHALSMLNVDAATAGPDWPRLDDAIHRAAVAEASPTLLDLCAGLLDTEFDRIGELRRAIQAAGRGRQTGASINRRIVSVVGPQLLRQPAAVGVLDRRPSRRTGDSWRKRSPGRCIRPTEGSCLLHRTRSGD